MKTLKSFAAAFVLGLLALVALVSGCSKKPTFHITYSDECAEVPLTGTMAGIAYALARPPGKDFLACYGLATPADIGHDFPAEIDPAKGEITIALHGTKQIFVIEAAHEVSK